MAGLTDAELDALELKESKGLSDEELDALESKGLSDEELSVLEKKPVILSGPKPVSQIIPPITVPISTSDLTPAPARASEPPVETAIVAPGKAISAPESFQPTEGDIISVLSKVKPEERELAAKVFQRDVKTRADLNILQGRLAKFGKEHGFGVTAGLIEDFLNPNIVAETALGNASIKLGKLLLNKYIRGSELLTGKGIREAETLLEKDIPVSASDVVTRKEIEKKKQTILQELYIPDDLSMATKNDPTGVMKKRLALPGETGAEVVVGDRASVNDPLGILAPKSYRVVPVTQEVPDYLIKDLTPEGVRNLALSQSASSQEQAGFISKVAMEAKKAGRVIGVSSRSGVSSEKASKKIIDNVRSNVIQEGEDLGLYGDAQRAIQVETEVFENAAMVAQALNEPPMNDFQVWVNKFRSLYTLGPDMLKNIGGTGNVISKMWNEAVTVADVRHGSALKILNSFRPIIEKNPVLKENLVDVLENRAQPMNAIIKKAAIVIRGMFDQIGKEAKDVGIKVYNYADGRVADFALRMNYFPRYYDLEQLAAKGSSLREETLNHIMASKNIDRSKAVRFLDDFVTDSLNRFGSIEKARVENLPGYSKDVFPVLNKYFSGAFKRLEVARQFGVDNEIVGKMVATLPGQFERDTADAVIQMMTGKTANGAVANFTGEVQGPVMKIISKSMMGLSAIMNSTQGVYGSLVRDGMAPALNGFFRAFSSAKRAEAHEAGVMLDKFTTLFDDFSSNSEFFKRNGFTQTEGFSRTVQALSESSYLDTVISKLIKTDKTNPFLLRELERLGLNAGKVLSRGYLSADEKKKAVVRVVALTQGRFDPANLPIFSAQPLGKILYHLKSFDLLWFKFARDFVYQEAKHGNFTPLLRLGVWGGISGEVMSDIWSVISGKERPEGLDRILENISYGSTIGIMTDVMGSLASGKKGAIERLASNPTFSLSRDLFNAGVDLRNLKFAPAASLVSRRVAVPLAVSTAGKVGGPVAGLAAGTATRAILDRFTKKLRENEAP